MAARVRAAKTNAASSHDSAKDSPAVHAVPALALGGQALESAGRCVDKRALDAGDMCTIKMFEKTMKTLQKS